MRFFISVRTILSPGLRPGAAAPSSLWSRSSPSITAVAGGPKLSGFPTGISGVSSTTRISVDPLDAGPELVSKKAGLAAANCASSRAF